MKIALLYFYELMIGIIVMSPVFSNKTALASDQSFIAVSFATFDIIQQQKLSAEGRLEYRLNKGNWQFDPKAFAVE